MNTLSGKPILTICEPTINNRMAAAYKEALNCLVERLTPSFNLEEWNSSGLMDANYNFIVAGGAYPQPWQRDTGFMTYDAANLLIPNEAKNMLWSQVGRENDKLIIKEGLFGGNDQYWDRICWAFGAWNHYLVTGDKSFLTNAYEAISQTLSSQRSKYYNATYCLFVGGSVLDDNIDAYDEDVYDYWRGTAAVAYPVFHTIMSCSNNLVWYEGYVIAGLMAQELEKQQTEIEPWNNYAEGLKESINNNFWLPGSNRYADYMLINGTKKEYQNDLAQAFAITFGVADATKVEAMINNIHFEPQGIPHRWPHATFAFSDQKPSREGNVIWGNGQAAWAEAMAYAGRVDLLAKEINDMARNRINANGNYREIFDAITGEPEGGWESNGQKLEKSEHDQGWSATGFIKAIHYGVMGMRFESDGLSFAPSLPEGWEGANLTGVKYRGMILNIKLTGIGNRISSFLLDGTAQAQSKISSNLTGIHNIEISLNGGAGKTPAAVRVANFLDRGYDAAILNGIYDGIDFGTNHWKTGGDNARENWQRHMFMNSSSTSKISKSLTLSSKTILVGLRAWTGTGKAQLELASTGNPTKIFNITNEQASYRTDWKNKSSDITISITGTITADDVKLSSLTFMDA